MTISPKSISRILGSPNTYGALHEAFTILRLQAQEDGMSVEQQDKLRETCDEILREVGHKEGLG